MMQQSQQDVSLDMQRIDVDTVVGFNGTVRNGLQVHPDRQHLIYPLGCAIVIEDISSGKADLLWGHTDTVTCLAVSNNNGKLLASGQKTHMGFLASAIVWNYEDRELKYKLELHKVNIQALVFSPNDMYLATLGGFDDGSVVIWNMVDGLAICGAPAQVSSAGNTLCISFSKKNDDVFVTGGDATLRVWELDVANRKIRATDVDMGLIRRIVQCISMDDKTSDFFYCGTTTGDILAINMESKRFQYKTPEKCNFQRGVTALVRLPNGNFLVGSGCGILAELCFPLGRNGDKSPKIKIDREWKNGSAGRDQKDGSGEKKTKGGSARFKTEAAITSIGLRGGGHQFFVGTDNGGMYKFSYEKNDKAASPGFDKCQLIKTSHSDVVTDVVFPEGSADIILTCQKEQIRAWSTNPVREMKRFIVANKTCNTVALACRGQAIVSAWDDGVIRVCSMTKPNNDIVLIHSIENAHNKGVTALACTNHEPTSMGWDFKIISGGGEGQVRIWRFCYRGKGTPECNLEENLKEHKGKVSSIKINRVNNECVSSSMDGTCIIWNLVSRVRKQMILANTLFKCVMYDQHEVQIITCGTDRKIGYWECHDGSQIREVEGATTGSVNSMDISSDGNYFVTGGDDRLLKIWTYKQGEILAEGKGHSAAITKVKISPGQKLIASVSEDGAIIFWKFPFPYCPAN